MSERKLVLVTGATGAQGGGLVRHLLADPEYAVRALTRNPGSTAAQQLSAQGADVVQGDLSDPGALAKALHGCWGCFGVTNFWEHFESEYDHGTNLIDAVAGSDVQQFILSTLPSPLKITNGELSAPHLDIKARLEEYAREAVPGSAFIHPAFYYQNFMSFFPLQKQQDGSYVFGFPQGDTPLAGVAAEDIGGVVKAMFDRADQYARSVVGVVGDDLTGDQYADVMSRILGRTVVYQHVPRPGLPRRGRPCEHVRFQPPVHPEPPGGHPPEPRPVSRNADVRAVDHREPGSDARQPGLSRQLRSLGERVLVVEEPMLGYSV